jgi:hypothetical protein
MKHFYNARNIILYIQDIEIINAFCDGVNDVKIIEEIAMKEPKTMVGLLTVADVCIKASETQAWLLESHGMGPAKKKQNDQEVNTIDRENPDDHSYHGYRRNHHHQPIDQKEKRHLCRPDDVEKWCEIHRTVGA